MRYIEVDGIPMYEGITVESKYNYISLVKPDILIHIRDNWVFTPRWSTESYQLYPHCKSNGVKLVLYSPVQSIPYPPDIIDVVKNQCDFQLVTNKIGVEYFIKNGVDPNKIDYLYHGVDRDIYYPRDKAECKKEFGVESNDILLGYVAMNIDYRKMIPLAMLVFKKILYLIKRIERIDPLIVLFFLST